MGNGAIVPPQDGTDLLHLEQDALALQPVEFDAALVAQLDKAVDAYKKIIGIAIRLTNPQDWFDQNGKPYLGASGAEKIASPFLVTMGPPRRERLEREDDKGKSYIWVYEAMFTSKRLGRSIVAQGKCASRDQFFGQVSRWEGENGERKKVVEYKPLEDIKEEDVMQAAYTNCFLNGVVRLLGIRNLTWEQLAQGGIHKEAVGRVEYQKGSSGAQTNENLISDPQRKRLYAIAKQAGWSDDALKAWLKENYKVEHTNQIKRNDYQALCDKVELGPLGTL